MTYAAAPPIRGASATLGDDRVEGVEHRRDAAVVRHPAAGLELDAGVDPGDLAAAQPDEVERAGSRRRSRRPAPGRRPVGAGSPSAPCHRRPPALGWRGHRSGWRPAGPSPRGAPRPRPRWTDRVSRSASLANMPRGSSRRLRWGSVACCRYPWSSHLGDLWSALEGRSSSALRAASAGSTSSSPRAPAAGSASAAVGTCSGRASRGGRASSSRTTTRLRTTSTSPTRLVGVGGGGSAEDGAQEPAGAVDAHEADDVRLGPPVGAGPRDGRGELAPERSGDDLRGAALGGDAVGDLGADVLPAPQGPRAPRTPGSWTPESPTTAWALTTDCCSWSSSSPAASRRRGR